MIFNISKFFFDFFVIVFSISIYNAIFPYLIYNELDPFPLIYLVHGFVCLAILLIRFKKPYFPRKILKYPPFIFLLLLMFLQFFSSLNNQSITSLVLVIIYMFFVLVFITYIFNVFKENTNKIEVTKSFIYLNKYYISFIVLNFSVALLAILLINLGVLESFSNNISHMFDSLFGDNVENGGTVYYMPSWLSIQTQDIRLGFAFGSTLGYMHEPHVFNFLSVPVYFFLLSVDYRIKFFKLFLIIIFAFLAFVNFSGTTGIAFLIITVVYFFVNRNIRYLFTYLLFLFFMYLLFLNGYFDPIMAFYENKAGAAETSLDYSTSRILSIINPNTIIGDGVLLLSKNNNSVKNGGFFTSIFYVLFYLSCFIEIKRLLLSKDSRIKLYGFGFLYFILHGFKMSSKFFIMPITIYFITVYFILKIYIIPSLEHQYNENT